MSVTAGQNDSGFHGYALSNLYPGMSTGMDQKLETVPDPQEQTQYTNIETPIQPAVDKQKSLNIWMLLGGLFLLVVVFGKG